MNDDAIPTRKEDWLSPSDRLAYQRAKIERDHPGKKWPNYDPHLTSVYWSSKWE